ncbi:carbamoyltransferase HypF [Actinophytocola sp.]|uniref:carbamoyltransferase HypF n=1 Tax=Actinophytocola sp. TaxID=1872138 RepID=UPI002ED918F0
MSERVRRNVRVEGVVQGVGFRPFVYGLATRIGVAGRVGNDVSGVFVEVEGTLPQVEAFLSALAEHPPPLAAIERITTTAAAPTGAGDFSIVASEAAGQRHTLVSADSATCDDCLRELADAADRRFGYPFINCTNCGPRFTIVRDVPYDRPLTTMAGFAMCEPCAAEYHDPTDRRFHAQPTCCADCGPRLRLDDDNDDNENDDDNNDNNNNDDNKNDDAADAPGTEPIAQAAARLKAGQVLAIKGIGGYHLAVLAGHEAAAAALRERKHREDKPFAVMVSDVDTAGRLCELDPAAVELLTSRRRPIVLLTRRTDGGTATATATDAATSSAPDAAAGSATGHLVAPSVAPGNRQLGLMLPYTPMHHLLLRAVNAPIVLTSGNVSDEPIAYTDDDARRRLGGIAEGFLTHDRPIHIRTDDSVVRPFRGRESVLRRSRGYVPEPVTLRWPAPRPILACGAELKNTFCLAKDRHAFVSHHIGDLENYETLRSYVEGIEHFGRLFDVDPVLVAHDLHPEYLSTKHAMGMEAGDVELVGVQHHHAHIASCLADNGEPGPVLGVAFDGLGYGTDGTIWGGEFLLADLAGFERVGHLEPVALPGGTAAIRQPWRMAAAYLDVAYAGAPPAGLDVLRRNESRWADVLAIARAGTSSPPTSSAGRLFDAVSALLGLRDTINYEGQAAVELEQLAEPAERGYYVAGIGEGTRVAGADLVRAAAEDLRAGVAPAVIAARFHNGVVDAIGRACLGLRDTTGVGTVALSGGVFQNLLLLNGCVDRLTGAGFRVLTHGRVPTNDGGISLGQAAVAAARDRAARDRG